MGYAIKCYQSAKGKCPVQERYNNGSAELKAGLDVALEYLQVRDRKDWGRPHASKLPKGNAYRDYFEIRFKADRVQQRPIGFFGPEPNTFTILIWAIEKGDQLIPTTWYAKAERCRSELLNGTAIAKKFKQEDHDDQ